MLKTLVASTFLAATLALPVMAADSGTAGTNMNKSGAATTGTGTGATPMTNTTTPGVATDNTTTNAVNAKAGETDMFGREVAASNIMGASVMDAEGKSIGEIDDLVLSGAGSVSNYVVDVGGFLGIGEKRVALTPKDVTITADASGNIQAKTQLTKDALTARPDYTKPEVPEAKSTTPMTTAPGAATPKAN
jgi:sporulation protein YlmC with PRC-barrel domain